MTVDDRFDASSPLDDYLNLALKEYEQQSEFTPTDCKRLQNLMNDPVLRRHFGAIVRLTHSYATSLVSHRLVSDVNAVQEATLCQGRIAGLLAGIEILHRMAYAEFDENERGEEDAA